MIYVVRLYMLCCLFFFSKQKTAYERRISDWSSDVCSSDLDDLVPLLVSGSEPARADAGVGDHDRDRAELGDALVEGLLQGDVVAHVGLGGEDPPPEVLHQADRLVEVLPGRHRVDDGVHLLAQVDGDDVGTVLGQAHGVVPALAARSPCDERDLTLELAHERHLQTSSGVCGPAVPLVVPARSRPASPSRATCVVPELERLFK